MAAQLSLISHAVNDEEGHDEVSDFNITLEK